MAATRSDISQWFDDGVKQGASHMIVVCDDFDYEDYPVYVHPPDSASDKVGQIVRGGNMQRVMECYDLRRDKDAQLTEYRAFHY